MSLLSGFFTLGNKTNKTALADNEEGVISELLPEMTLDMSDDELISLKKDWLKLWEPYAGQIQKLQDDNEDYWTGKQFTESLGDTHALIDNLTFEALETFLPIATRPKAEPVVESDNSEPGKILSDRVRKMLSFQVDTQNYNLKLKSVVRFWALYLLGVMKTGWSQKENDITCLALRPQKLILDPEATIDCGEYTGEYIGEYRKETARNLIKRFPKKQKDITEKVKGKLGTRVQYIEWWTDEYLFWTFEDEVLGKTKNPHFNYETEQPAPMNEFGSQPVDEKGQPQMVKVPPKNHFKHAKKPYFFLSIFNIGKHPHDDTNLIRQILPLQDLINKRLRQIDKNADNTNGGLIVSGDFFTKEQAAESSEALRKGGTIYVPTGDVNAAVRRDVGAPLPPFIYESLLDYRNELRNIFGIRGSAPQGTINERTVRGKVITKTQDSDRIGGGISIPLEQFSDKVFNYWVQLMYVYYDEPHTASVLGKERANEYIQIKNSDFVTKLDVTVKEGSMIPHDPLTQRNEAMDLWAEGALDPITLFDRLEFPNPRETAKQLFLWKADPIALFPDLAAQQQQQQKPEGKPPSESINFKDLPPEGQAQLAAKAGIQLNPQQIIEHHAHQERMSLQKEAVKLKLGSSLKAKETNNSTNNSNA